MKNIVFERLNQSLYQTEVWRLSIGGSFLRVVFAQGVDIAILKNGRKVGTMKNCKSGDYLRDFDFDGLELTLSEEVLTSELSYSVLDVYVEISSSGAGSEKILGEVNIINEMLNVKQYEPFLESSYKSSSILALNQVVEVLNPVNNINGIKIKNASIMSIGLSAGAGLVELIAYDPTGAVNGGLGLPSISNLDDYSVCVLGIENAIFSGGVWVGSGKLENEVSIRGGLGLYYVARQSESVKGFRLMNYYA